MDSSMKMAMSARAKELAQKRLKAAKEERRMRMEQVSARRAVPTVSKQPDGNLEQQAMWQARKQELARRASQAEKPVSSSPSRADRSLAPQVDLKQIRPISSPSYERLLGAQSVVFRAQDTAATDVSGIRHPQPQPPRWS